jgi:hypothetical protein
LNVRNCSSVFLVLNAAIDSVVCNIAEVRTQVADAPLLSYNVPVPTGTVLQQGP